jgi:hypothetical protein
MRDTFGAISRSSSTLLAPSTFWIKEDAGHVPAGTVYAFDQSMADRVSTDSKDHRHRVARKLRRPGRCDISCGGNCGHTHSYEFGRKGRQCAVVTASPPFLNTDIATLNKASLR